MAKQKKIYAILMVMALLVCFSGCSQPEPNAESSESSVSTQASPPARVPMNNTEGQAEGEESAATGPNNPNIQYPVMTGIISGPPKDYYQDNMPEMFNDRIERSLAVSAIDPCLLFVGSEGNGVFKSTDGGNTWEWQRSGILYFDHKPPSVPAYPEIFDTAINPSNLDIVYIATTSGVGPVSGGYPSATGGVYKTVDGGKTWARIVEGLQSGSCLGLAIDEANPDIVFVSSDGGKPGFTWGDRDLGTFEAGLYKSTDGGNAWNIVDVPGAGDNGHYKTQIIDSNTIFTSRAYDYVLEGVNYGLLKSIDGGKSWAEISPEGAYISDFDVARSNNDVIYINDYKPIQGEGSGIYRSVDGGITWKKTSAVSYGALSVSPFDEKTIMFSFRGKLYLSTDSLDTYHEVYCLEEQWDFISDVEFSLSDPDIVYAGAEGLLVLKSTDGGKTWTEQANLRAFMDSLQ